MSYWFTEELGISGGHRQQIEIKKSLYKNKSQFQMVEIVETVAFGRMLILDNTVMTTEFDEFCYHEMISHPALFSHPNPQKVLVVGGGDGGTVREVLKHPGVSEVHLCELDEEVVTSCREHIPSIATAFDDPRLTTYFRDGVVWVADNPASYDVILVDSTDPVGPAEALFGIDFIKSCHRALTPEGILVNQAENFMLHLNIVKKLIACGKEVFARQNYYYSLVPTYPGGMIGFTFFSKGEGPQFDIDSPDFRARTDALKAPCRYWTPEVHRSAFNLPGEYQRKIFE